MSIFRDVAQPGSAHVWGAWGRKFESCHPDLTGQIGIISVCPVFIFAVILVQTVCHAGNLIDTEVRNENPLKVIFSGYIELIISRFFSISAVSYKLSNFSRLFIPYPTGLLCQHGYSCRCLIWPRAFPA